MKKYGLPFLILIGGSFLIQLVRNYIFVSFKSTLISILTAILLFGFGISLHERKRKSGDTWLKKMIIMFVYVVFLLIYLGTINIPVINSTLETIGFTSVVYYMLFIYLGFVFFS